MKTDIERLQTSERARALFAFLSHIFCFMSRFPTDDRHINMANDCDLSSILLFAAVVPFLGGFRAFFAKTRTLNIAAAVGASP